MSQLKRSLSPPSSPLSIKITKKSRRELEPAFERLSFGDFVVGEGGWEGDGEGEREVEFEKEYSLIPQEEEVEMEMEMESLPQSPTLPSATQPQLPFKHLTTEDKISEINEYRREVGRVEALEAGSSNEEGVRVEEREQGEEPEIEMDIG